MFISYFHCFFVSFALLAIFQKDVDFHFSHIRMEHKKVTIFFLIIFSGANVTGNFRKTIIFLFFLGQTHEISTNISNQITRDCLCALFLDN